MATVIGVRLNGRFAPGQKVELFERFGDVFDPATAGGALKSATVDRHGNVAFTGLDEGKRYWIAGQDEDDSWRGVAMTAKARQESKQAIKPAEVIERLAQTRPSEPTGASVTGARSSSSARALTGGGQPFANPKIGKPTPKERARLPAGAVRRGSRTCPRARSCARTRSPGRRML
jgi:hypothetical protein